MAKNLCSGPSAPDPRTGALELRLDVLDWIHAITAQISDCGQHLAGTGGRDPFEGRAPPAA